MNKKNPSTDKQTSKQLWIPHIFDGIKKGFITSLAHVNQHHQNQVEQNRVAESRKTQTIQREVENGGQPIASLDMNTKNILNYHLSWVINVTTEHHPTMRYLIYNCHSKVMSNSPKMGHLPIPVYHFTFIIQLESTGPKWNL